MIEIMSWREIPSFLDEIVEKIRHHGQLSNIATILFSPKRKSLQIHQQNDPKIV